MSVGAILAEPRVDAAAERRAILEASAALDGWLAPGEAETLLDLAAAPGEGAVVEIGSYVGKSLVCLAGGTRLRGGGRVVSIDPHGGSPEHQPGAAGFLESYWDSPEGRLNTLPALRRNLEACGLADAVELVASTSDRAAAGWNGPIRLLFVDGNHGYLQVARDLRNWTRWVAPGGSVALHDYGSGSWPGVSRAVDEWLARETVFEPATVVGEMLVVRRRAPAGEPVAAADASLAEEWRRAVEGDPGARGRWEVQEGGEWSWDGEGVRVASSGSEWAALAWRVFGAEALRGPGVTAVEVTVRGSAVAAGLSLGPFRDFLVEPAPDGAPRRLRLELHPAGLWSFHVDGVAQQRRWWDGAMEPGARPEGTLTLKACGVEELRFSDLRVERLPAAPCRLSVIVTCHRFAQRLRVTLRGWCGQRLPPGALELLVVNPQSPDGTAEQLASVARAHPQLRVREIRVPAALATQKGAMINAALDAAGGEWVWLADADCLYGPLAAERALGWLREGELGFCERRYLGPGVTASLLSGVADPVGGFGELARAAGPRVPHREPWGYCQIVHRSVAERVRYTVRRHFAESDLRFAADCAALGLQPSRVPGLLCLHLEHPFAWFGTREFL